MTEIWQAIQPYSSWIFFALFLLLMLRMHAGGGCGSHRHTGSQPGDGDSTDVYRGVDTAEQRQRRSGGCH
jgi:hypothetical protein